MREMIERNIEDLMGGTQQERVRSVYLYHISGVGGGRDTHRERKEMCKYIYLY
jgi:hypothetical protein